MSASEDYQFNGYRLRPAMSADLELARAWTAADPDHAGTMDPDYWLEQQPGIDSYVLEDEHGPVFYLRMHRAVRLFIQFNPRQNERARTRNALTEGLKWLETRLAKSGCREIFFGSVNPLLRVLAVSRMKFWAMPETLSHPVDASSYGGEYAEVDARGTSREET